MVLLRELDDAKDYPAVIHHVGSDWERQVRAHYTRADGTLNINGYYSEMFGFTVKSSDFESGSSDNDSSGNDSDCVIISSSESSSTNPNNRSLIVADSVATISTSMEISSRFTTDKFVSTFRQAVQVSGEGGENWVVIDLVALGEVMNVAPCQLHPNSWAFLKAFQDACEGLDLVPTAGVFFCFFHVKNVSPHSLISISSQPNKGRFSLYASNFKNYRDTFVRFRCGEGFPELMFDAFGNRLFPFYWSSSPRLIKGTRTSTLNEYERLAVSALSKFQVLSSVELISREDKPQSFGEYMGEAALVLKARPQKAEAERASASTDVMSQLVVKESGVKNTKRKNSEGSGRIPVEIPKKIKVTVVDEEEDEDEDEPLKLRRTSKGRGLAFPGEGGSNVAAKGKGASSQCCPSNPEARKGRKSNLSASLFTKDFDSFGLVDEGFQKYARTSHLSELTFEDPRQAAMDHHIQADNGLSALENEFAAAKSKFDEDLAAVKAEQEQKMKAKDDEMTALKGNVKALEGELRVATQGKEEASQKVDALTAKVDALEMDMASQYDDGFRRQVIVIESSESDKADSDYVEFLRTYRPEDESWDSDPEDSQLTAESKLIPGKEKNSPCNKEG
ncbi:hypothetical protein TSUD_28500 [Trifolium subterraneum]|uniref:Uncharacterized protein n=1 Tax=Trifolium subterraneum TaxID=3900 RepID=A0A2Z6NVN0_TRISU|nr:hypothetical protein TSUD_28500 [Trifolium subterraneum]